ncbi:MAG: 3D domain-containing protein [Vicinamibacterales bacterium]
MTRILSMLLMAGFAWGPPAPAPLRPGRTVEMEVTAYCLTGTTASGAHTRKGIVAADPRLLPLGSRVRVRGLGRGLDGTYDVEDTGRLIKGRELDLYMRDCDRAIEFGRQDARVTVLALGPSS